MYNLGFKDILALLPDTFYKSIAILFAFQILGLLASKVIERTADRLPDFKKLFAFNDYCPGCGEKYRFYQRIPVFSFVFCLAKCKNCKKKITKKYLFCELFTPMAFVLFVKAFFSSSLIFTVSLILSFCICQTASLMILKGKKVPVPFYIPLLLSSVASAIFNTDKTFDVLFRVISSFAAGLFVLSLELIAYKIKKKPFESFDDSFVSFAVALSLGWDMFIISAVFAAISSFLYLSAVKIIKRGKDISLSLTPFLTVGFVFSAVFGNSIIEYLLSFIY